MPISLGGLFKITNNQAPLMRYADLEDVEMVASARNMAEEMLEQNPAQVDAHLARWLGGREDLLKA